jgi:hypothetical protein
MGQLGFGFACVMVVSACGSVPEPPAVDGAPDAPSSPTLTSISPTEGIVTTQVTLTGDFDVAEGSVSFGGSAATIASWSETQIVAAVPGDRFPGDVDVTVTDAYGTTGAQTFRVTLPPRVYINNGSTTVTVLDFDPATRALAVRGAPVPMGIGASGWGGCATSAIVHEPSRRLFASGSTAVAIFDINPVSGDIVPITGSPFPTGAQTAWGMDVTDDGTRLYIASQANGGGAPGAVTVLDIEGGITPIIGSPVTTGFSSNRAILTDDEQHLIVNSEENVFGVYAVAANGAISPIAGSPFANGQNFSGGMRPGVDTFYTPLYDTTIAAFAIAGDGQPTAVPGSPFAAPAGMYLHYPAFTPDGSRMYVGYHILDQIAGYAVAADGSLTPLAGSPWNSGGTISSMTCTAISRDGGALIISSQGNAEIGVFDLAADGTPTQVSGSPFALPTENAHGMAITF